MNRRPYIVAGAFVGGIAIAALIVVLVILLRGDDGDDAGEQAVAATPTVGPTAAGSPVPGVTPPAAPPAGALNDPDDALNAFIVEEYGTEHIGECPQELVEGEPVPKGICSIELYRGEELVTFLLGEPFSEGFGEAIITRSEDDAWSVKVISASPFKEEFVVGSDVVVFGAGNCLNFRDSPSVSGEVQSCQIDGTTGEVVDGPQEADDHTWWKLEGLGWSSGQYLRPVVE